MSNYDPYRASTTGYALPPQGPGMQYGRLLSFVFESPNWLMNLVWGALCTLLSSLVVGQLVMHGYQAQIMIGSVQNPNGQYPDFDSNKIGDYLVRGLWIWLGMLISSLLLGVVFFIMFLLFAGVMAAAVALTANGQGEPSILIFFMAMFGYVFLLTAISIIAFLIIAPVTIKIGLTGNLGEMFDLAWHLDFVKKMFGSMVLGAIMVVLISLLLSVCGMVLCFVGVFPAAAWIMMSQANLYSQLYLNYLERGGRPVPIQLIGQNF